MRFSEAMTITAATMAVTGAAFAQQQQRPSDDEVNGRLNALSALLTEANTKYAVLSGAAEAQLRKLQAELEAAKKAAEACKPAKAEEKK